MRAALSTRIRGLKEATFPPKGQSRVDIEEKELVAMYERLESVVLQKEMLLRMLRWDKELKKDKKTYDCNHCGSKNFQHFKSYQTHVKDKHPEKDKIPASENKDNKVTCYLPKKDSKEERIKI